ncbi:methionyl-tRNA formyltransferase [Buchnera aphidicola]|uniref:Methionyl-tRNA formyltransferase n=1 Tax=Buchnera aphidicola (Sarucallis kahawaluokalani) TaxID=1241878 RepID=A0A4D6YK97_9GAMM|nr:methionyl-tRNA formyltransferase [Buchnera aphidicola]QCI26108.1 methionyl-tRNA formyltransferase [Buchnera aphidicola (Sarucallis kahawaluokalani)]
MNNKPLKIIFAGTSDFSAEHLKKILSTHHKVLGILTQPDRPNHRNKIIITSAVKKIAIKNNIPVFQPDNIQDQKNCHNILTLKADIMVVIAYGLILPNFLLRAFPMGCINLHASLLPRWRGAAPVQWAILHGDKNTGISIIQMEETLDTGKILYQKPCNIAPKDTTNSLLKKLCQLGKQAILYILQKIQYKNIIPKKQNIKQITYAKKLSKKMGKINFKIDAITIERMIRALNPWPGTYINVNNTTIKIHQAEVIPSLNKHITGQIIEINTQGIYVQTKHDVLNIQKIQIPSKKIITISQFIQQNHHKILQVNQIL